MSDWFNKTIGEVLDKLEGSREAGLAEAEALVRREKFGPNELQEKGQRGAWQIFGDQFKETLMIVLMIAAAPFGLRGRF